MNSNIKNPLIHIGYHKTATTWLQKNLFISENKTFEPFSIATKGHSSLARHFFLGEDGYLLSPFNNNIQRITEEVEKIRTNNTRFKSRIPVISHERLSGNPASSGFDAKKIATTLKEVFPKAKVLVVIREQTSFILSIYFQHLSTGGMEGIKKFLNTKYDGIRPYFSPRHIEYISLVSEYYRLFGRENVLALPYEMFKTDPSLFVRRLGLFLQVEINQNELNFGYFFNKKKHHFVNYYMRFLNLFTRYSSANNYSPLCNRYTEIIGEVVYNACGTLTPNSLDVGLQRRLRAYVNCWIGDRYIQSNQELSRLIEVDLAPYGYYEDT